MLSHEARLDRAPHTPVHDAVSVNLTQGIVTPASHSIVSTTSGVQLPASDPEIVPQFDGSRSNHGGRGFHSRGGGRSGCRTRIQCQICSKMGHDAQVCYFRLSPQTAPTNQWRSPAI